MNCNRIKDSSRYVRLKQIRNSFCITAAMLPRNNYSTKIWKSDYPLYKLLSSNVQFHVYIYSNPVIFPKLNYNSIIFSFIPKRGVIHRHSDIHLNGQPSSPHFIHSAVSSFLSLRLYCYSYSSRSRTGKIM